MNKKKLHIVLFFMLSALIIPMHILAQSDKTLVRQGNKDYQGGNFNEAEINYRKALDINPKKQSAQFNLGDALYEQENYEKAAEVFASTEISNASDFEKSNTLYNLGNSFLKGGKLKESIAAYKQSLKFNPRNEEARYNLEYARQKQQQQNQDQNQDQNKDDKNEDKQDQNQDQKDQNQDQQDQDKEQQEQNQDQQDQQNQDQQNQQNQQGQQNEQQAQKISKKDAERMLEALKNNEKKTLEKLKKENKQNAKVIKSEKDW